MAYATLTDVNDLVPNQPFSETSKPTAAAVNGWLDDIAGRIDATLGNVGYLVPIASGPVALLNLKRINAWGALGIAQMARATSTTIAGTKGTVNEWYQMFQDELGYLVTAQNPFELSDAQRTAEQLEKQPENVLRSSVQSIPDFAWTTPAVTRNQVL